VFRYSAQPVIASILVVAVSSSLLGASPVIGVVTAQGNFRVGNVSVNDNANLLDGSTIVTGSSTPLVDLKDGAKIQLGTSTNAAIRGHVIDLRQGIGEVRSASDYSISAGTLRIAPTKNAAATVQVVSEHRILVAAVMAPVNVYNRNGLPVAMVRAGETLSFDPLGASPEATSITGCLLTSKDGKPILVDPQTFQVSQLIGGNLSGEMNNRVTVTGDITSAGKTVNIASQALQVTSVTRVAAGGCAAVAADPRIGGTGSAAAPTSHKTAWIVGGVVVGGGAIAAIVIATHNKS
jgi:hypothetical protein